MRMVADCHNFTQYVGALLPNVEVVCETCGEKYSDGAGDAFAAAMDAHVATPHDYDEITANAGRRIREWVTAYLSNDDAIREQGYLDIKGTVLSNCPCCSMAIIQLCVQTIGDAYGDADEWAQIMLRLESEAGE